MEGCFCWMIQLHLSPSTGPKLLGTMILEVNKLRWYHQSHIYLHPPISCRHVVPKSDCERSPWEMEMRHRRFLPWVVSKFHFQTKVWRLFQVVSNSFYFHPYLGKWSNLPNIFQRGWNHQLVFLRWASELFHILGWSNWFHAIQAGVEWIALDSHEDSYNLKQEGCCHQATGNTCEKSKCNGRDLEDYVPLSPHNHERNKGLRHLKNPGYLP